jgi:hypothetical protein
MNKACLLLTLFSLYSLQAQVWQFDVDAFDAPSSETLAGYARMSGASMTGNSTNGVFTPMATSGNVVVSAAARGGFRDRGTGSQLSGVANAELLRDFVFTDGSGAEIVVTITGLPAGLYDARSFHFDNGISGAPQDNAFDLIVNDASGESVYTTLPWSLAGSNYRLAADGSNSVSIIVREANSNNRARLNGIRIVRYAAFDVDASDAPDVESQPGFVRLSSGTIQGDTANGPLQLSAAEGNLIVTAAAASGFRDRGPVLSMPNAALLRDFVFSDGAGATIQVTLSGLISGVYEICSFHSDSMFASGAFPFDILIEDADGSRTMSNQVWSVSGSRYAVRSDGLGDIFLTFREANADSRVRFNGIEIGGGEVVVATPILPAEPGDKVIGDLVMINDNAGWCWYQDEKVIFDSLTGTLITSTIGNALGYQGPTRDACIEASSLQLFTGKRTRVFMGKRGDRGDDHNMGALWIRPDGRYIHFWTGHNDSSRNSFFRISSTPHDPAAWGPEQFFNWRTIGNPDTSGNITYHNVHFLPAEGSSGRLYNITRESQRSPNIGYSDDYGDSWHYGGKLTLTQTASSYSNGYLKFCDNGADRIDFITTEHHPRDYNTSIYHGYIKGGQSFNSFGAVVDTNIFDEIAPAPEDFTPVFISSPEDGMNDHVEYHRAWTIELERDISGGLYALFTTRYGTNIASNRSGDADHRLFYARFDGSQWHRTELGKMGGPLYFSEQDYTGLGAIDPNDPGTIFISTNFDPRDSAPLPKREIFKGVSSDQGLTWHWTAITSGSTVDNLRLAIPRSDARPRIVCWFRGDYVTQRDFDQTLVCLVENPHSVTGPIALYPVTIANTSFADGSPLISTGPSTNNGATDDNWHLHSGYGDAGGALVSSDAAPENAPMLRTSVAGVAEGLWDVFAFFWSRPGEDWRIKAGFSASDMLVFRRHSSQQAETNAFIASVQCVVEDVALYRAYVGRMQLAAGSTITVFVDDFDGSTSSGAQRTAYHGIGVAPVVPVDLSASIELPGGAAVIRTSGLKGRSYQLQRSPSIGTSQWENIGAPTPGLGERGLGVPLELTDTNPPQSGSVFYRVLAR